MKTSLPEPLERELAALGAPVLHTVKRAFAGPRCRPHSSAPIEALHLMCFYRAPRGMPPRTLYVDLLHLDRPYPTAPSKRPQEMFVRIIHRDGKYSYAPTDLALLLGPDEALENAFPLAHDVSISALDAVMASRFLHEAANEAAQREDLTGEQLKRWITHTARRLIASPSEARPSARGNAPALSVRAAAHSTELRLSAPHSREAATILVPTALPESAARQGHRSSAPDPARWTAVAGLTIECLEPVEISHEGARLPEALTAGRYEVLYPGAPNAPDEPTVRMARTTRFPQRAPSIMISPASGAWRVWNDLDVAPQPHLPGNPVAFAAHRGDHEHATGVLHRSYHKAVDKIPDTLARAFEPHTADHIRLSIHRDAKGRACTALT